jgi:hypothetical protein
MTEQDQRLTIAVVTGIILGVTLSVILATGCVSKHPRCAAYDKIETVEK